MENQWHLRQEVELQEQGNIKTEVFVPVDSIWFSGHFPGEPILPGFALIYLVWQAIVRCTGEKSKDIMLDTLKRVRFTQPVRPGDKISILISCGGTIQEPSYSFKVISRKNVICSGVIAAGEKRQRIQGGSDA